MFEVIRDATRPIGIRLTETPPLVYMDHWAMCEFAEQQSLGERLLRALGSGATLGVSWVNALELAALTPGPTNEAIHSLAAAVGDAYCLLENDPGTVHRQTQERGCPEREGARAWEFGKQLASACDLPGGPVSLDAVLQDVLQDKEPLRKKMVAFAQMAAAKLSLHRSVRGRDSRPVRPSMADSSVDFFWSGLLDQMRKQTFPIDQNNVIDLMHAAVACAVCDFVLLDKHWHTQVGQLRDPPRVPRVYCRPQLEEFLADLEAAVSA